LSSPTADIAAATALSGTVCGSPVNGTAQNGLIADFCNQVTSACGNYLGGLDMTKCVQFFAHIGQNSDITVYPDGTTHKFPLAPATGSGLPCRRYHVQVGRQTTDTATLHCPHAIFGDDACGSTCETYCTLGEAICPSEFDSNCMADCSTKVPVATDFTIITNKDIVCRLYHLSVAVQSAELAGAHCPHTSILSTEDTCGEADGAASLSVSALFIAVLALITKFSS